MSAALLRGDLKAELEELDQRYGNFQTGNPKQQKRSVKKRFKRNPKVDELAKALQASPSARKKLEKETIRSNAKKLLELSAKSSSKKVALDPIYDQITSSKRYYEPKGRSILKPRQSKKQQKGASASVFTDKDFEEFSKSYFVNTSRIAKSSKKSDEDLD